MIVRAKTPKGLSWTGRLAVMGMAALILPLAPSWARQNEPDLSPTERERGRREARDDEDGVRVRQVEKLQIGGRLTEELQNDPELMTLSNEIAEVNEHLTHIKKLMRSNHDPATCGG